MNDEKFYRQLTLSEIDKTITYSGYLWFDNENTPKVIDGKLTDSDLPSAGELPYVIEGNLVAKDGSHSISIRFLDGRYIIIKVYLQEAMDKNIRYVNLCYLAHGFATGTKLYFKEAWLPVVDSHCADMKTLQPAWIAFVGFDCKEDEKND